MMTVLAGSSEGAPQGNRPRALTTLDASPEGDRAFGPRVRAVKARGLSLTRLWARYGNKPRALTASPHRSSASTYAAVRMSMLFDSEILTVFAKLLAMMAPSRSLTSFSVQG